MDVSLAKRRRLWNPAVEEGASGKQRESDEDADAASSPLAAPLLDPHRVAALAFAAMQQPQLLQAPVAAPQPQQQPVVLPFMLQPYLSMAPALLAMRQQQQHMLLSMQQHFSAAAAAATIQPAPAPAQQPTSARAPKRPVAAHAKQHRQSTPPQSAAEEALASSAALTPPASLKQASSPLPLPSSASVSPSGAVTSLNPLVQSALGIHVPNENCCAICGAAFRLTTDLVTHMRTHHRRARSKRAVSAQSDE